MPPYGPEALVSPSPWPCSRVGAPRPLQFFRSGSQTGRAKLAIISLSDFALLLEGLLCCRQVLIAIPLGPGPVCRGAHPVCLTCASRAVLSTPECMQPVRCCPAVGPFGTDSTHICNECVVETGRLFHGSWKYACVRERWCTGLPLVYGPPVHTQAMCNGRFSRRAHVGMKQHGIQCRLGWATAG